jgi:hypothetical protein
MEVLGFEDDFQNHVTMINCRLDFKDLQTNEDQLFAIGRYKLVLFLNNINLQI